MTITSHTTATGAGRRSMPPTIWTAPVHPRTWRELLYVVASFPIGVAGFCFVIVCLAAGLGLAVTVIGFPLLAMLILACRGIAGMERARARGLLGERVPEPTAFAPGRPGFLSWLRAALLDGPGWRGALYLLLLFPWSAFTVGCLWAILAAAGLMTTYPIWRLTEADAITFGDHELATLWEVSVTTTLGVIALFLVPWLVHGFTQIDRIMVRGLLGPWTMSDRVRDLEASRGRALDTAAADLRQIERDLHDGAQARLVALAMDLGMAKEKVTDDPAAAQELIAKAHEDAKQVLAELHDIARGIYPAILTERGLDAALSGIAARCSVPASVSVDLDERPAPATEAVAYYCASELLTNVAKHSGATAAALGVGKAGDRLRMTVRDNGSGGADPARGTGLAGLADRVHAVDGVLQIDSPGGGPTTIIVELPWTP